MAISWTNCKNALTPSGSACSDWALFTGSGYCRVVEKTVSGVNFHLYARVHSPSPSSTAPDTVSVTMYLFARKSSTTTASYNNDKNSVVKFTFGNVTGTSTLSKSRVPGSGQTVRCVGYKELTGVTVGSLSGRPFKAVFNGVPGSSDCNKTYTIEGTDMDWTYGNATISAAKNSDTIDAQVTGITTKRYIRTSWDWSIKNNTAGDDYTVSSTTTVAPDSTTTSSGYSWSNRTPGNNYTVRWRTWLRNYNPDDDASTKVAVLCSRAISVTCDKLNGKMTLSPTDTKEIKCHSSGTVKITAYHALKSISSSIANETIATRSRPTSGTADEQCTITVYGQKVGSTTLTVKCAATTSYKEASDSVTIKVVANPIATLPSPKSGLVYNGSSQTGVSGGAHWTAVSGTTATNAGSHTAKVKPATGYAWSDGTTTEKSVPWSIAQASGTLTLNSTAGNITKTFTYGDANGSVTVGGVGGTVSITAESSTAIANGTLASQTSLTIDPGNVGSATIKLQRAASTNYTASAVRTVTVTVNRKASLTVPKGATREWTGSSQTCTDSSTTNMTLGGTTSATASTDTYYTFTATPGSNYAWTDGTYAQKSINWYLKRKPDAVPPTKADRTWTGSEQNGYSSAGSNCTLSTTNKATAAGSYSYTATPNANHAWGDGTYAAKTFNWTMNRANITLPTGATRTWNGSSQTFTNSSTTYMTTGGTTSATNANSYTATVTPDSNHKWSDTGGTGTRNVAWSIGRANITLPIGATRTYNGSVQSFTDSSTTYMSLSGNTATDAGSYTATVTPDSNHKWSDTGGTGARTVSWKINKASGYATWSAANQSLKETQTYTASVSNIHTDGVLKLKSNSDSSVASCTINGANANIVATKLGTTTITLYVDTSKNYTASGDKSFTITVRPAEVKLGSTTAPVYLGSTPVRRIYLGDKIVIF